MKKTVTTVTTVTKRNIYKIYIIILIIYKGLLVDFAGDSNLDSLSPLSPDFPPRRLRMGFFSTIERLADSTYPTKISKYSGEKSGEERRESDGPAVPVPPAFSFPSQGIKAPSTSRGSSTPATEKAESAGPEQRLQPMAPPVDPQPDALPERARPVKLLGEDRDNFSAAWPWLRTNLGDLFATGWTRAGLFRRGENRYPVGRWGVAWLPVWRRPGLSVTVVDGTGAILFRFDGTDGRPIVQSAHPSPGRRRSRDTQSAVKSGSAQADA